MGGKTCGCGQEAQNCASCNGDAEVQHSWDEVVAEIVGVYMAEAGAVAGCNEALAGIDV